MDLTKLADEELDERRREVLKEQERRANLAAIPEQIRELAAKFREGGGEESALTDAISGTPDDPTD